jgi:hypothetical protein
MKLFDVLQNIPHRLPEKLRHSPLVFTVAGVVVIGGIALAIVFGIRGATQSGKTQVFRTIPVADTVPLTLQNPLIPPQEPAIPDDYLLYRERKSAWSDEEVDRWFTVPDSNMLRDLHAANDKMISELLRAAP